MRVLIVDDEPLAVEHLRRRLRDAPGVVVVGEAGDGDSALEEITALDPDVVLLDVQMPGQTGMEVARALAGRTRPEVIFVTAFVDHAIEAFELDAADYLLKPVRADRLVEAMNRARRRLEYRARPAGPPETSPVSPAAPPASTGGYEDEFWIKQREGYVRVNVAQIRRIEANRDYALIHTRTRTFILRTTMGDLEQRLDPRQMLRVHRSAFVRPDTVERVERNGRNLMRLHTVDGAAVDVGVRYAKRVAEALGIDGPGERVAS